MYRGSRQHPDAKTKRGISYQEALIFTYGMIEVVPSFRVDLVNLRPVRCQEYISLKLLHINDFSGDRCARGVVVLCWPTRRRHSVRKPNRIYPKHPEYFDDQLGQIS